MNESYHLFRSPTVKDQAEILVLKFSCEINETDLHLPEIITGKLSIKDYRAALEKETMQLAARCALIHIDGLISSLRKNCGCNENLLDANKLEDVKKEIKKLSK